ncbi:MAG: 50S ribosomal protein L15 [Archaeoglobi archaeon]|nr:50S ribosomal protein L15 [Candidatus Mnemosynella sp.]
MAKKKVKKYRGSRTCGGGTHKNRRGAGNRGGRGFSGGCKHQFVKYLLMGRHIGKPFGKHGFKPKVEKEISSINIGEIDERIEELLLAGIARRENDLIEIRVSELGAEKVLGGGQVRNKLIVIAREFSENAIRKIEEAGGKAVVEE